MGVGWPCLVGLEEADGGAELEGGARRCEGVVGLMRAPNDGLLVLLLSTRKADGQVTVSRAATIDHERAQSETPTRSSGSRQHSFLTEAPWPRRSVIGCYASSMNEWVSPHFHIQPELALNLYGDDTDCNRNPPWPWPSGRTSCSPRSPGGCGTAGRAMADTRRKGAVLLSETEAMLRLCDTRAP